MMPKSSVVDGEKEGLVREGRGSFSLVMGWGSNGRCMGLMSWGSGKSGRHMVGGV